MTKEFKLINLNIGEKKFSTYDDTLTTSSYFQKLIENKRGEQATVIEKDNDQVFFIDRDGDVSEEIMHYLRSLAIRAETPEKLEKLVIEATFFDFKELVMRADQVLEDINVAGDDERFYLEDIITNAEGIMGERPGALPYTRERIILNKIYYKDKFGDRVCLIYKEL